MRGALGALIVAVLLAAGCAGQIDRSGTPAASLASVLTPAAAFGTAPTGPTEAAAVVRIVDGDTIVVDRGRGDERVRYIGVDTPETVKPGSPIEWLGPEATAANRALVAGCDLVLERDVSETDRFGRLLRYIWCRDSSVASGWRMVNLELVAQGFAQMLTFPPDVKYVELYHAAQVAARDAGLGLWGPAPSATP